MDEFPPDAFDPPFDEEEGVQLHDSDADTLVELSLTTLGRITQALPGGGETRDAQRTMVELVTRAFATNDTVAIEAGTGVGKSLAYLVPAALSGKRVVVATGTKNLQDQLGLKDAPTVARAVPGVSTVVLKGRSNYLCQNRMNNLGVGGQMTFDDGEVAPTDVVTQVRRIIEWSQETDDGDLDALPFEVDSRARRQVTVTPHECPGRTDCPDASRCYAEAARDRAANADIIITNYALYAAHIATGHNLLPSHDYVIFDEAHDAPEIFSSLLGTSLAPSQIRAISKVVRTLVGVKGEDVLTSLNDNVDRLVAYLQEQSSQDVMTGLSEPVRDVLAALETDLSRLGTFIGSLDGEDPMKLKRAQGPLTHLRGDLERLRNVTDDELVHLTRVGNEIHISLSFIEVGGELARDLWPRVNGVLTSATIPDRLPQQLGLPSATELTRLPSPFNYKEHSLLYIPDVTFPDRRDPGAEKAIENELVTLINAAGGRTLALFTNRSVLERVAAAVGPRVEADVLVQGTMSRQRLIETFRDDIDSCLFATASFWQGIDVPGHALSLVVIDRLPFSYVGDPLSQARRDRAGDAAFRLIDLPRATMLLAQGVGRLIRSADDKGVVAVLDTRLASASYRSAMLNRLPPMKRTRTQSDVVQFLSELRDSQ